MLSSLRERWTLRRKEYMQMFERVLWTGVRNRERFSQHEEQPAEEEEEEESLGVAMSSRDNVYVCDVFYEFVLVPLSIL